MEELQKTTEDIKVQCAFQNKRKSSSKTGKGQKGTKYI